MQGSTLGLGSGVPSYYDQQPLSGPTVDSLSGSKQQAGAKWERPYVRRGPLGDNA